LKKPLYNILTSNAESQPVRSAKVYEAAPPHLLLLGLEGDVVVVVVHLLARAVATQVEMEGRM